MDSLGELAQAGARRMIAAALELEVEQYAQALSALRDEQGHALVVRNGRSHHERTIQMDAGSINGHHDLNRPVNLYKAPLTMVYYSQN